MRNPGRAEIARAVPPGSRRLRSQPEALAVLPADPALAELRADYAHHIGEVWRRLVRSAAPWAHMTVICPREQLCRELGISVSTWKRCRRWIEEHGYLGCVVAGSTPELDGMRTSPALIPEDAANTAAVYVLTVPRKKQALPPPPSLPPVTGPPARLPEGAGADPARRAGVAGEKGPASRPGSLPAVAAQMRKGPGQGITDGWCAHLAAPFTAAGYSPADVRRAIDYEPGGVQHRNRLDRVKNPAAWLRARLAAWLEPGQEHLPWKRRRPVLPRSLQRAVDRQQLRAAQQDRRARMAEASAAWTDPAAPAAAIRQQHGWRKASTNPGRKIMTLHAYDSAHPEHIPAAAAAILPYADGRYRWPLEQVARFPDARRRYITVAGNAAIASVADVEAGDLAPGEAPAFIRARRILFPRTRPTIYCNRSTLPLVQEACAGLDYNVWLATLDGDKPTAITGGGRLVAVQFEGGPDAGYDVSVVYDEHWLR
jgi:hypothetical protein